MYYGFVSSTHDNFKFGGWNPYNNNVNIIVNIKKLLEKIGNNHWKKEKNVIN